MKNEGLDRGGLERRRGTGTLLPLKSFLHGGIPKGGGVGLNSASWL